jgi:secreted trypsin-like serine protease
MRKLPSTKYWSRFLLPSLALLSLMATQFPSGAAEELSAKAKSRLSRIVGGTVAPNHAYPWMVALETRDGFQFCGGTLITATKVLTAAHCSNLVSNPRVRVGSNLLTRGQLFSVTSQKAHPKFTFLTIAIDYDVAVWTLATPVTLSDKVNLVELPAACTDLKCITGLAEPGATVRTIGWGNLTEGGTAPNNLRQVDVPLIANATCNTSAAYDGEITSRMICAGFAAGGKDSCQGDSGGPLFGYLPAARSGLQTGIVSSGDGCARPDKYGIYTRISNPDIRKFIRQEAGV